MCKNDFYSKINNHFFDKMNQKFLHKKQMENNFLYPPFLIFFINHNTLLMNSEYQNAGIQNQSKSNQNHSESEQNARQSHISQNQRLREHPNTIILALMEYVYDVFWTLTPNQYRLNMKDQSFTFYEKGFPDYCFQTLEDDLADWKLNQINSDPKYISLAKNLVGVGPKVVLRQILILINQIIQAIREGKRGFRILPRLTTDNIILNQKFKFMRFSQECLALVSLDYATPRLQRSVKKAWKPLVQILVYTLEKINENNYRNKYYEGLLEIVNRSLDEGRPRLVDIIEESKDTQSIDLQPLQPKLPIIEISFPKERIENLYVLEQCFAGDNQLPTDKQSKFFLCPFDEQQQQTMSAQIWVEKDPAEKIEQIEMVEEGDQSQRKNSDHSWQRKEERTESVENLKKKTSIRSNKEEIIPKTHDDSQKIQVEEMS